MAQNLGEILTRIDQRIRELGLSDRNTSTMAGVSPHFIRSVKKQYRERKQHSITEPNLEKLAKVLQITMQWLLTGKGPKTRHDEEIVTEARESPPTYRRRPGRPSAIAHPLPLDSAGARVLPVAGVVAAGVWIETPSGSMGPPVTADIPSDPRHPTSKQYAVMVRGTSINRVAQDGDFLIVVDRGEPRSGDLVIAIRTRGGLREAICKQFYRLDGDFELRHDSVDPIYTDKAHESYQPPIRCKMDSGKTLQDDGSDTEISIGGIVTAVYRPLN